MKAIQTICTLRTENILPKVTSERWLSVPLMKSVSDSSLIILKFCRPLIGVNSYWAAAPPPLFGPRDSTILEPPSIFCPTVFAVFMTTLTPARITSCTQKRRWRCRVYTATTFFLLFVVNRKKSLPQQRRRFHQRSPLSRYICKSFTNHLRVIWRAWPYGNAYSGNARQRALSERALTESAVVVAIAFRWNMTDGLYY